ncbi:hypothetical protein AGRO_4354 [Agrobacterium sp. ATCC 31749]|nr:hypothetical protein AGRO_4354 [Agrobacterium sp. ATCC 31749]
MIAGISCCSETCLQLFMLDEKNIPASTACAYVLRFPLPRQNFMPRSEKIKKGFRT